MGLLHAHAHSTAGLSLYMQNDGSGRSTYAIPYIQLSMRATGRGKA